MNDSSPYKSGFLTSEFMLTVLGVIALVVLVLADKVEGQWAAIAIGVSCLGYSGSRAVVKSGVISGAAAVASFKSDLAVLATATSAPDTQVNVNVAADKDSAKRSTK